MLMDGMSKELSEFPSWFSDLIHKPKKQTITPHIIVEEGGRRDLIFRYGCALRNQGFEYDILNAALLAVNQKRCSPPLEEKEVEATSKDICERYKQGSERGNNNRVDINAQASVDYRTRIASTVMSEMSSFYRSPIGRVVRVNSKGLEAVSRHIMTVELTKYLRYVRYRKVEKALVEVDPPSDTAMQILGAKELILSEIESVTTVPRFTPFGTLCDTPGYNPDDKSFYVKRFNIPDVPYADAWTILDDFIWDFAWSSEKDRTNAVALLLSPPLKSIIKNFPLYAISSVQERTGKSLLMEC